MPTWIMTLIAEIGPLTTAAEGIAKFVEHVYGQFKSGNGEQAVQDVATHAQAIGDALNANTPADTSADALNAADAAKG